MNTATNKQITNSEAARLLRRRATDYANALRDWDGIEDPPREWIEAEEELYAAALVYAATVDRGQKESP